MNFVVALLVIVLLACTTIVGYFCGFYACDQKKQKEEKKPVELQIDWEAAWKSYFDVTKDEISKFADGFMEWFEKNASKIDHMANSLNHDEDNTTDFDKWKKGEWTNGNSDH